MFSLTDLNLLRGGELHALIGLTINTSVGHDCGCSDTTIASVIVRSIDIVELKLYCEVATVCLVCGRFGCGCQNRWTLKVVKAAEK